MKKEEKVKAPKQEEIKPMAIAPVAKYSRQGILGSVKYGRYVDFLSGHLLNEVFYTEDDIKTILKEKYNMEV